MNYNHSKPNIPPPPALPRFTLPNEGSEEGVDPLDVAATTERPAMDTNRARRVLRAVKPKADATSEVQVEDILLEVYTEDAPPPTRRSGVTPPLPSQSAAVDALLRASDPAFLPFGGPSQLPPPPARPPAPSAFTYPASYGFSATDHESPSVAPVAFPSGHMQLAPMTVPPHAAFANARPTTAPRSRGAAVAIWTSVLLVVGLAAGTGAAIGVREGTYARLRDRVKAATARGDSPPAAAAAPLPSPSPSPPAAIAPPSTAVVAPAAPAAVPTVSVDSLPQQAIPADSSLVTFPASAQGRRVFFDGRPMAVTSEPVKLRCGRHMIRIGSTGKARVTDLPCGREITVKK